MSAKKPSLHKQNSNKPSLQRNRKSQYGQLKIRINESRNLNYLKKR